ncbi:hypothetical protein L3Q82_024630, partial [Scortum barcoo]
SPGKGEGAVQPYIAIIPCEGSNLERRVIDYAIEFCTLAVDSGWNSPAMKDAFINGLNDDIKDQLAPHETPAEFEDPGEGIRASPSHQEVLRTPGSAIVSPGASSSVEMKPDLTSVPVLSDYPDLTRVPPCYHDLREVFNKTKAMSLPPQLTFCLELPFPRLDLYAISGPERKAMDGLH